MKHAVWYCLFGTALAGVGAWLGGFAWLLLWPAVSYALIGGGRWPGAADLRQAAGRPNGLVGGASAAAVSPPHVARLARDPPPDPRSLF